MSARKQGSLAAYRLEKVRTWLLIYIILLVFEGVLRKWASISFLMSSALLLVRDPVALFIYYLAARAGAFPNNRYIRFWVVSLAVLSLLGMIQVFFSPWLGGLVVLYGVRCYCLHVPLIFIMARVFRRQDVERVGRWALVAAAPMALLMIVQFFSPPDSFVNRATMGEGSTQIGAALGHIRPAATFSYGTGATAFNLVVAAFLVYSFIERSWSRPWMRWAAAFALVVVLPISGSRTFVLSLGILMGFALVGGVFDRSLLKISIQTLALGAVLFVLLSFTAFFREGLLTFTTRWQQALGSSGSVNDAIVQRFFGEFINAFEDLGKAPAIGYGLGLASNVGAALTVRSLGFLLAESEWERTVMEMGGVAVLWLGLRCAFGVSLYWRCWSALRGKNPLPWLLLGTECVSIFNGLLEQTTNLGFLVVTTGLCLAAIRMTDEPAIALTTTRREQKPMFALEPA